LNTQIESASEAVKKMRLYNEKKTEHILMGLLMNKLRGRVPAPYVAEKIGIINGGQK